MLIVVFCLPGVVMQVVVHHCAHDTEMLAAQRTSALQLAKQKLALFIGTIPCRKNLGFRV